ncbi:MAG TPA: aldehyde ferredoxin oxidoreductase C-terminal domain-containing protein [Coriobacteriia bacterium]|nr:aldehyde ferredoxin oxidoreductase C-terminal domain-containing protein [Coriobacteriia bacterium]
MRELLRVNMADLSVKVEPVPEEWAKYGGRALTDAIIYKEVPADADPLGPAAKLVFSPGTLGGTTAPNGGRLSVGGKSPLTGGIKESNSGGQAAHALARVGYSAIVVEGKPADPTARYVLTIEADRSAKIDRVDDWAGLGNYEVYDKMAAGRPEGDRFATISIGPAGEMGSRAAGIAVSDPKGYPNRFAGRGGLGAVMGSKGLKGIVISYTGTASLEHADKEAFTAATRKFSAALKEHAVSGTGLPMYGTNVLTNILNEAGGLPTRNFSAGSFEFADAIGGETQRAMIVERSGGEGINDSHGCHSGCVIKCSRYWMDKDGHYKTKGPEYETAWAFGADCGIGDLDGIAELDRACGDLGLDTIEMGGTMGVYMASGALEFGDAEGALKALLAGADPSSELRVLWDGAEATGIKFGVKNIPVVKHQSLPAYDPRSVQGIGVTYATTPMGADHTAGYTITANILAVGGTVDPLGTEGQAELSKNLQIATAMLDSLGLCIFVAFPVLDIPDAFTAIHEMVEAHTGEKWGPDELMQLGREVLTFERLYNKNAGFTAADDRLPEFFLKEPLPPHNVVFTVTDEDLDSVFDFVDETAVGMGLQ